MKYRAFILLLYLFPLLSSVPLQKNCQTADNFARFITANPILARIISGYENDPVAHDISTIFEAGLRKLFNMNAISAPEYTAIRKSGNLVTIDFNLGDKKSGILGRMSFYYHKNILKIRLPSIHSSNPGDSYFLKFINGFYHGVQRVVKQHNQPIEDIRIVGGMVTNKKLKKRLTKLGFTKKSIDYSIWASDYAPGN